MTVSVERAAQTARRSVAVRRRSILAYRHNYGAFANTGGDGQTISFLCNLESVPQMIRLLHENDQTGSTWALDGAAVAPTSQAGGYASAADDNYRAYNGAGSADDTLWQSVTYNNGGANTDWFSQAAGSTKTLTVPVAPAAAGQPSISYSDWMPIVGLDRIDGGPGALVLVRIYSATRVRYGAGTGTLALNGRRFGGYWKSGNYTSTFTGFTSPSAFSFGDCGLQYVARGSGLTVMGVGDSIAAGLGASDNSNSYCQIAAAQLSQSGFPVSCFNNGFSGRTSADFMADAYRKISALKPGVAVIEMFSGNDSVDTATANLAFERGMALADHVIAQGGWPILTTYVPRYVGSSANDAVRRASNDKVRLAGRAGYDVLDVDAILGTGATPNAYQSAYDSGDHIHPSDVGYAACAAALSVQIQNVMAMSA